MILKAIAAIAGGSQVLTKAVTIITMFGTLSGGAIWLYSSIKAQGKAEAAAEQTKAQYEQLEHETGAAIARLNQQHAADIIAANRRRVASEQNQRTLQAQLDELEGKLNNETDECLDKPIPAAAAEWVRNSISNPSR